MDSGEECAAAILIALLKKKRKRKKKRLGTVWLKPWFTRKYKLGVDNTLVQEFRLEDEDEYKRFLRMTPNNFNELLKLIETDIQKQNTHLRDAIPAKIKLAATLRFLATGSNCTDLQHLFRVQKSTLSQFIPKVCETLYEKLKDDFLKV